MMRSVPELMRAAVLDGFGGIDRFKLTTVPVPEVRDVDILIRVEAAGVGSWDAVERAGQYDGAFGFPSRFPYILGWDGAGTVAAVGASVTRFVPGDRVYAASMPLPRGGFYAEYAVVDEQFASHVPAGMDLEQAAAMPWDALTALSGLDALHLTPGATLMIFGASGGIGHMALQFARRLNARTLAVASGADGVALATRLGADVAIDGRREDVTAAARAFAPGGLDAALVTAGGKVVDQALQSVRDDAPVACPHGVLPQPQVSGPRLVMFNGERNRSATDQLNRLVDTGPFEVHLARVFTLDEVAAAHRALSEHYLGKIVMRIK